MKNLAIVQDWDMFHYATIEKVVIDVKFAYSK